MSVELTTPATYTCKCDRDGTVETIQGSANDAYAAGWIKVASTTAAASAKTDLPMPALPVSTTYDLCPACAAAFATFMGPAKR